MSGSGGYIYVLTNPSFPEYVKIGYADNVDDRVAQLNRFSPRASRRLPGAGACLPYKGAP